MRTLPIGIFWLLDSEGNTQWGGDQRMVGAIYAGSCCSSCSVQFAQRYIVEGIAAWRCASKQLAAVQMSSPAQAQQNAAGIWLVGGERDPVSLVAVCSRPWPPQPG